MFILLLILVFLVLNLVIVLKIRADFRKSQAKIGLIENRIEVILEYWICFQSFLESFVEGENEE